MPEADVQAITADATAGQQVRFVTVLLLDDPDSPFASMVVEHLAMQCDGVARRTPAGYQLLSRRLPEIPAEFAVNGTVPLDPDRSGDPAVALTSALEKAARRAEKAARKAVGP